MRNNNYKIFNGLYEKLRAWRVPSRIVFVILGVVSTVWFLFRVIPKPSRASYPCVRTAAPFMSAFVIYLLSIATSVFAFKKFRTKLVSSRYIPAFGFLVVAVLSIFMSGIINNQPAGAIQLVAENAFTANDPIGTATGIHPGRVVWVWDADATDENCTNTAGDYWFDNTDAAVVENMLTNGIMQLAGETGPQTAWDALFKYFNKEHGKGNVGYTAGEKVYIKINVTNSCCSVTGTRKTKDFDRMDATPEALLALLKNLVEYAGVPQENIYCGDPFRTFHNLYWDMCHSVYPDISYTDGNGINGRHQTVPTASDEFFTSDGLVNVRIPSEYVESSYFINLPCLKSHDHGGITLGAKNHQGSILQDGANSDGQSAEIMHNNNYFPGNNGEMGSYRHLVDYMGHEHLGGKTLLTILDGIWAGKSWQGYVEKWNMEPFNNDYPSSFIISQDLVAIESVGWDFLLEEYSDKSAGEKYPYMEGVEDYILQAADPGSWADGITYDPENDGSAIGSLGVYEHWNNPSDKQYSRDLGTGEGIELVKVFDPGIPDGIQSVLSNNVEGISSYPNPATDQIFLEYALTSEGITTIEVYAVSGKKLEVVRNRDEYSGDQQLTWNVDHLLPGNYLFRIEHRGTDGSISIAAKKFLVK